MVSPFPYSDPVFLLPCPAEEESDKAALGAPGAQPGSAHHSMVPTSGLQGASCLIHVFLILNSMVKILRMI